jgi:hypothetical protein
VSECSWHVKDMPNVLVNGKAIRIHIEHLMWRK